MRRRLVLKGVLMYRIKALSWNIPAFGLVEGARELLTSGVSIALQAGQAVCIQLPRRTVLVCFHLQKQLLCLPFRCLNKIYESVLHKPVVFVLKKGGQLMVSKPKPSAMEVLTGMSEPNNDDVIRAVREVRSSVLEAVDAHSALSGYRRKLDAWKADSEKRTEEVFKTGLQDKEVVKNVALMLRYLRMLKSRRSKLSESFDDSVVSLVSDGTLTSEKLLALQKNFKMQESAVKDERLACLNSLSQSSLHLNVSSMWEDLKGPSLKSQLANGRLSSSSGDLTQRVVGIVADENLFLKNRLSLTHEKMEQIVGISKQIQSEVGRLSDQLSQMSVFNEEMGRLQERLQEGQKLLLTVQQDRDAMRAKLESLDNMISEEEEFLNHSVHLESDFEDAECLEDA